MKKSDKDLIKSSWSIIEERVDDLVIVYEKLYQIAPDTRAMFSIGIKRQARKLKDTLAFVVENLDNEEKLIEASKELGVGHKAYPIKDEHYEKLNRSFVEGIEEIMGKEYNDKIGKAWMEALSFIGEIMIAQKGKS